MPALARAFADFCPGIIDAIGNHRPAMIFAGLRLIQLVTAACAMLDNPQLSPVLRVKRRRLHVTMAIGPDLRPRTPSRPTNGLSFGMPPSGWILTTLPNVVAQILRLITVSETIAP